MDKDRERTNPAEAVVEKLKRPAHQVTLDIFLEVINYERRSTNPNISGVHPGIIQTCERILSDSIIPSEELPVIIDNLTETQDGLDYGKLLGLRKSIQTIIDSQTLPSNKS